MVKQLGGVTVGGDWGWGSGGGSGREKEEHGMGLRGVEERGCGEEVVGWRFSLECQGMPGNAWEWGKKKPEQNAAKERMVCG